MNGNELPPSANIEKLGEYCYHGLPTNWSRKGSINNDSLHIVSTAAWRATPGKLDDLNDLSGTLPVSVDGCKRRARVRFKAAGHLLSGRSQLKYSPLSPVGRKSHHQTLPSVAERLARAGLEQEASEVTSTIRNGELQGRRRFSKIVDVLMVGGRLSVCRNGPDRRSVPQTTEDGRRHDNSICASCSSPSVRTPWQSPDVKTPRQDPNVRTPRMDRDVKIPRQGPDVTAPRQDPDVKTPKAKGPWSKKRLSWRPGGELGGQTPKLTAGTDGTGLLGDLVPQIADKVGRRKSNSKPLKNIPAMQVPQMKKRRAKKLFKIAASVAAWCISLCKRTFQDVDLLFDPSKFKANRKSHIPRELKRIFGKRPEDRTDEEICHAQIAMRNIKSFAEYPGRVQKKIVEVGLYETYEARRLLLKKGHLAHAFYFILSGSVSVIEHEDGKSYAQEIAHLDKGQSFGERAVITRDRRECSIVVKEKSEFLSVTVDDYHGIFMSGGVRTVADPDHEVFIKSLPFLQGWPVQKLSMATSSCVFLYFKRGDMVVEDSRLSEWIVVVKSGSLSVLKTLSTIGNGNWKRHKGLISEKEQRERCQTAWKQRQQVRADLRVPLRTEAESWTLDQERESLLRPFVHPQGDVLAKNITGDCGISDAKAWDLGTKATDSKSQSVWDVTPVADVMLTSDVRKRGNRGSRPRDGMKRPLTVGAVGTSRTLALGPRNKSDIAFLHRKEQQDSVLKDNNPVSSKAQMSSDQKEKRTANSGTKVHIVHHHVKDYGEKPRVKGHDDAIIDDRSLAHVPVQTLTKGMVFGLSDLILGQKKQDWSSHSVVSNGADVLLISKELYFRHAPEALLRMLKANMCPYPSDEDLHASLKVASDWLLYRQRTLADTLHAVRTRKLQRL